MRRLSSCSTSCVYVILVPDCRPEPGIDAVVGFCFSFPMHQTSPHHGRLIKWSKGFTNAGAVGKDPAEMLEQALRRQGMPVCAPLPPFLPLLKGQLDCTPTGVVLACSNCTFTVQQGLFSGHARKDCCSCSIACEPDAVAGLRLQPWCCCKAVPAALVLLRGLLSL